MGIFKDWFLQNELAVGSDGNRNNASTQTSQATSEVGQKWLSNPKNAMSQSTALAKKNNPSAIAPDLLNFGAQAIKSAPPAVANQTTAPMVASFMQTQLGLPNVVKAPKPNNAVNMMRKR